MNYPLNDIINSRQIRKSNRCNCVKTSLPAETQDAQGCGKEHNGFLAPILTTPLRYTEGGIMSEAKKRKQYDELDFTDDFMFCKILQSDKNLCKELTELILSRKIGEILQVDSQNRLRLQQTGRVSVSMSIWRMMSPQFMT